MTTAEENLLVHILNTIAALPVAEGRYLKMTPGEFPDCSPDFQAFVDRLRDAVDLQAEGLEVRKELFKSFAADIRDLAGGQ